MKAGTALSIIERCGQIDFKPVIGREFVATGSAPGSQEKIDVLAHRAANGFPLFHEHDRVDYSGLVSAVRPREPYERRQEAG